MEFQQLSFNPRSPAFLAFDGEIQRKVAPVVARMAIESRTLEAEANDMQGEQGSWRDFGGLLQMIGLVLAFAGNILFFKREG